MDSLFRPPFKTPHLRLFFLITAHPGPRDNAQHGIRITRDYQSISAGAGGFYRRSGRHGFNDAQAGVQRAVSDQLSAVSRTRNLTAKCERESRDFLAKAQRAQSSGITRRPGDSAFAVFVLFVVNHSGGIHRERSQRTQR